MKEHIFMIATGRSYLDFQEEKIKYLIPYHYLIINHGATILKNEEIIYNVSIDNDIKNQIWKDLQLEQSIYYFVCSGLDSRVVIQNKNITKIHVRYKSEEEAKIVYDILNKKYSNHIQIYFVEYNHALEIVSKKVNKAIAIEYVSKLENVNKSDIYAIGDNITDIEMVKLFHGFAMTNSVTELKSFAIKEYNSVSDLMLELIN